MARRTTPDCGHETAVRPAVARPIAIGRAAVRRTRRLPARFDIFEFLSPLEAPLVKRTNTGIDHLQGQRR